MRYEIRRSGTGRRWATVWVAMLLLLSAAVGTRGAAADSPEAGEGNPFTRRTRWFVDPNSNAARQVREWRATRPEDAAQLEKIASQAQADWFGEWSGDIYTAVRNRVTEIRDAKALPVLVAYNIPFRDCGQYSAGGTNDPEVYKQWIADFARGIGDRKAAVILEPDALPLTYCLSEAQLAERFELLRYAVRVLESKPWVAVYIDAGHSNWWPAEEIARRLRLAGVEEARGFSLNVSNYQRTDDLLRYGRRVSDLIGDERGTHFVIDTSRNGNGPWVGPDDWCNPPDRALGERPSVRTADPLADAYLWIKRPGESDGTCRGGPPAGTWWPEYALGLAQRAGDAYEAYRYGRPELEKRAVLPADTFAEGPVSGRFITPTSPLRTPPFPSQPVQGISAVNRAGEDEYWAMPDNGYGAKTNSADFLLRVYRLRPNFRTDDGGKGTVQIKRFISLRDPDRKIPFAITNQTTADRLLTGADFDIESFRIDRNGDLWFGEEFGPYLLHTDRTGKLLDAPFPLPGLKSPQNPTLEPGETPNLPGSRGFEAMALSKDGKYLYPMLEGALTTDPDQRRRTVYEFDIAAKRYTGKTLQYRVESPEHATGDMTAFDGNRLLVIERDNLQGPAARFKKLYLIDLRRADAFGFLAKREVADLLAIEDPEGVSLPPRTGDFGIGDPFSFPFQTIESVLPLSDERVLVINDNNYPFSAGRNPARPDDTELIVIRIPNLDDIQVGAPR